MDGGEILESRRRRRRRLIKRLEGREDNKNRRRKQEVSKTTGRIAGFILQEGFSYFMKK